MGGKSTESEGVNANSISSCSSNISLSITVSADFLSHSVFFLFLCHSPFCEKRCPRRCQHLEKEKSPPPILPLLSFSHPLTASSDFISFLAPLLIFSPFYLCSFPILLLNSESATMSAAEATSKGTQG